VSGQNHHPHAQALLALGSNLGDCAANLAEAIRRIEALPGTSVQSRSAIYSTPPWGKRDQPAFLNAVIAVETAFDPHALLTACLAIEAAMGRERRERWGPRLIDLDILTHGDAVIESEALTLPHPAITSRAFVLIPLRDVAPDLLLNGEGIKTHLSRLPPEEITQITRVAART
jgi:2-amino-4-hydroxy-6-hydroxymethyldihydropteridine diphosphokinase